MAINNSLAPKAGATKPTSFTAYLSQTAVKNQINSILGSSRGTSFIANIVSAFQSNPSLQKCTHASVVSAALLGESLGLSPSVTLGQFWMIPYENKKKGVTEAQFQLGAAGYRQLAMRSNQYKDIGFTEVREGEYLGRNELTGKPSFKFISDDTVRESLPIVGYLAYFEMLNGFSKSLYFSHEKMLNYADRYSSSFSKEIYEKIQDGKIPEKDMWKYSSPWYNDFLSMAEKTLIKNLLRRYGILSTELVTAIEKDQTVTDENGNSVYIDNMPEEIPNTVVAETEAKVITPEPKDEPMNPPTDAEEMNAVQQELFS